MKHILVFFLSISAISASAQEAIERLREQRCPMTFYKRTDSTDLKITKSRVKARATNSLLIQYICEDEVGKYLNGYTLYLVITNVEGREIINEQAKPSSFNIKGQEILTYAQGAYRQDSGISFEVVPPNDKWKKDSLFKFSIYTDTKEIARRILFFD